MTWGCWAEFFSTNEILKDIPDNSKQRKKFQLLGSGSVSGWRWEVGIKKFLISWWSRGRAREKLRIAQGNREITSVSRSNQEMCREPHRNSCAHESWMTYSWLKTISILKTIFLTSYDTMSSSSLCEALCSTDAFLLCREESSGNWNSWLSLRSLSMKFKRFICDFLVSIDDVLKCLLNIFSCFAVVAYRSLILINLQKTPTRQ